MKLLIVGDLHGNIPTIYYKQFDAIIAPGDFCSDEPRKYMFEALNIRMRNPKSKIRWYDLVGKVKTKEMIEKSIKDGRIILEKLNSLNVPVYVVPGNWDWTIEKEETKWDYLKQDHYQELIKGLENIIDVNHKKIDLGEYQIIGHGISSGPEYPQYEEDMNGLSKKELLFKKAEYERMYKEVDNLFMMSSKPTIFLSHNVPFNTSIDEIINKKSPRNGYHYGSLIAREIIENYQPLICIGGHMHEHFGECKIKKTVCVNAGYGSNVNTFLELENNEIKKLEFHKGDNE